MYYYHRLHTPSYVLEQECKWSYRDTLELLPRGAQRIVHIPTGSMWNEC
jgi:hypothetical protein